MPQQPGPTTARACAAAEVAAAPQPVGPGAGEPIFAVQPTRESLVWQQNRLAEARYKLNVREQKLLLYVISMIEPDAQDFGKCKVNVQGYAEMAGLQPDDLYQELRDTALAIREKTLVVDGVLEPGMRRPVKRHGSWFEYVDEATGDGYVTIKLSSWLKPFLLQVRKEFFKYKLNYALDLKSEYSIRLYQWLKRWQFAGKKTETLALLRLQLGATEVDHEGQVIRENLAAYKHFKHKALTPALAEINARTDLSVTIKEEKVKGSKAVGSIAFSIRLNTANQAQLEPAQVLVRAPQRSQLELVLEPVGPAPGPATGRVAGGGRVPNTAGQPAAGDPAGGRAGQQPADGQEPISAWIQEFGLGPRQRTTLEQYVRARGLDYVREKAAITRGSPRDNAARAFLAALQQDWQAPKGITPTKATAAAGNRPKAPAPADEPPAWREWLAEKYPGAELPRNWRELTARFPSLVKEVGGRDEGN